MNIIDNYNPSDDINAHQLGVDSEIFFESSSNCCTYQSIPPLSDVLIVDCKVYEIQDPNIREVALEAVAAHFGMGRSQLKHLVSLYLGSR